eukprot:CAMPEP_0205908632 /NCGR_PEP_ID=MMETSP1325-20131115/3349_1 /ASSEMBLY_ACC=CAM_ASM_000708 /TAXON_ID=236786 /ORGANISM="Florenciella sp., Strain RCC1007" /LENGTH=101 /DNA_ID=CAMNT_0053274859 /DNA_START=206 /DNA_END=511 /DNA_ORIENTATION=-
MSPGKQRQQRRESGNASTESKFVQGLRGKMGVTGLGSPLKGLSSPLKGMKSPMKGNFLSPTKSPGKENKYLVHEEVRDDRSSSKAMKGLRARSSSNVGRGL